MNDKELDKTQYLGRTLQKQDTASMPPVTEAMMSKKPSAAGRHAGVRELEPLKPRKGPQKKGWFNSRRKKGFLLAGGFLVALFLGFMISGYMHDRQQAEENARVHTAQLHQQEAKNLKDQKAQLEQQKKELEAKQRSLQQQADRLQGKNDQMSADEAGQSTVGKIFDKVTGKSKQRQQTAQQNSSAQSAASQSASEVAQSIDDAQSMLDEVNQKLDQASQMKQSASEVKDAAAEAYNNHKGTIDTAIYYAGQGVSMLKNMLLD
jgi:methyl-accepting chemotaxis protein